MNTLLELKKWLKKPGNNEAKLASLIGFKTSFTVRQWILKERIPANREKQVITIIKGESK